MNNQKNVMIRQIVEKKRFLNLHQTINIMIIFTNQCLNTFWQKQV